MHLVISCKSEKPSYRITLKHPDPCWHYMDTALRLALAAFPVLRRHQEMVYTFFPKEL